MDKIFCIIPARGGSKAIPRKNIKLFCGKPLIVWSIEQALGSKYEIIPYVSSDDEEILKIASSAGAHIICRSPELSEDSTPLEPVIEDALESVGAFDTVLLLQPTSPVRTCVDIDNAVDQYDREAAMSLFSAVEMEDICLWKKLKGSLESVTYDYKNRGRRQDRDPYYLENGSIYVFNRDNLRFNNRLREKISIMKMPLWKSFELDSPEDWDICESFAKSKLLNKE